MKVTIKYPVLCVGFKEVELSNSDAELLGNCTQSQKAEIIEKYLTEDELAHIPGTIEGALEYEYAGIIY